VRSFPQHKIVPSTHEPGIRSNKHTPFCAVWPVYGTAECNLLHANVATSFVNIFGARICHCACACMCVCFVMYVCVCIGVWHCMRRIHLLCVHSDGHACVCMHACGHVCMCACKCVCMYMCVHAVCVCACMYVCVHVYVYMCM